MAKIYDFIKIEKIDTKIKNSPLNSQFQENVSDDC
jgi:hypothetical protein